MKFGLIQECELGPGKPSASRYQEMLDEIAAAEEAGFAVCGLSESHFQAVGGTVSAPEVMFGFLAGRTSTIRLRWMSVIASTFNHPLRTAERLATLDIISRGRAELGMTWSDDAQIAGVFGARGDVGQQWSESVDVVREALVMDPLVHDGEIWHIPPTHVVPNAVQEPHPPIYASASSTESHRAAGAKGVGIITSNSLDGGWDYLAGAISVYRAASAGADPTPGVATRLAAVRSAVAHCAENAGDAYAQARDAVRRVVGAKTAAGASLEALVERSPELTIGTPDIFLSRAQRLAEIGYDEFILRIDGMDHERHMQTIRLIGEHVIPAH